MRSKGLLFPVLALVAMLAAPRAAHATAVELELLLLVDVSGSISSSEYALQKGAYAAAFQDATLQSYIASHANGIAVAYAEWSGASQQSLEVGWTHLTDAASANAFAAAISGATRNFSGQTAPGTAINWGNPLFDSNGFEGSRRVMDISGDGAQNQGANTFAAATAAFAEGIKINGLAIGDASLLTWYTNNIGTPGGGFVAQANDFGDFQQALLTKITKEIVPEPTTLVLLGVGLVGVAGRYRRKLSA